MTTRTAPVPTPARSWPPPWRREPRSWARCCLCSGPRRFEDLVGITRPTRPGSNWYACRTPNSLCARLQEIEGVQRKAEQVTA